MKRRAALAALAWGCGGAALAPPTLAAQAPPGDALAWGPDGVWLAGPDGSLQHLPDAPAAGTRPILTSRGLWLVDSLGALRCWAPENGRRGDPWTLQRTVARPARVHALAVSPDGHWVAAAHGEQLSLLDANGQVQRVLEGSTLQRDLRGRAAALFALPQRRSFVAVWPGLGEVWEISTDPRAAPIFDGLVHDYRMGEAIATPGFLGARRAPLGRPLPEFTFADARVPWLAGTRGAEVVVVHLDVRRQIAALHAGAAHPAGATLHRPAREPAALEWWLPAGHEIQVFDTRRWARSAVHKLPGPVRQVHAVDGPGGAALWARVDDHGGSNLWRLDDDTGGWLPVPAVAGPVVAMGGTPQGDDLLVLCGTPPALLRLDRHGSLRARWPLPAASTWLGVSGAAAA